jgi:hypothetical protein
MTRTELIIQLLKVAIGLAFGAYFVWWSLQVLDRLTPEYDARTAESMAWTLAFGQPQDRTPTHWVRGDARGRDGGVRQGRRGVKGVDRPAGGSIQNDSGLPPRTSGRFRGILSVR